MKRFIFALCCVTSLSITGCSNTTQSTTQTTSQLQSIGKESAKTQKILLTNKTSLTIEAFFVKNVTTNVASDNLMKDNQFTNRQRRNFFYQFKEDSIYDIQIQSDGQAYNIHDVPFQEITEATLKMENDTLYLEYTDEEGNIVSTLELEQNYISDQPEEVITKPSISNTPTFVDSYSEPTQESQEESIDEKPSTMQQETSGPEVIETPIVEQNPVVSETPVVSSEPSSTTE